MTALFTCNNVPLGSSMSRFLSFLRLNNTPSYIWYITSSLFIYLSMNTWVVLIPWPLWIMVWWLWKCIFHLKTLILNFLDIYPKMEWLDHTILLFLFSWGTSILFFLVVAPIYTPANRALFSTPSPALVLSIFDKRHSKWHEVHSTFYTLTIVVHSSVNLWIDIFS